MLLWLLEVAPHPEKSGEAAPDLLPENNHSPHAGLEGLIFNKPTPFASACSQGGRGEGRRFFHAESEQVRIHVNSCFPRGTNCGFRYK